MPMTLPYSPPHRLHLELCYTLAHLLLSLIVSSSMLENLSSSPSLALRQLLLLLLSTSLFVDRAFLSVRLSHILGILFQVTSLTMLTLSLPRRLFAGRLITCYIHSPVVICSLKLTYSEIFVCHSTARLYGPHPQRSLNPLKGAITMSSVRSGISLRDATPPCYTLFLVFPAFLIPSSADPTV